MSEREKFITRAALLYAQSNLDDLNEAFENWHTNSATININGDEGEIIDELEIAELLLALQ